MDSPLLLVVLNHSTLIRKKQGKVAEIKRRQQKYIILIIMEFIEYSGKETAMENNCFFC